MDKRNANSYDNVFKNLAIGRNHNSDGSLRYFGDFFFDDYLQQNTENWFKTSRRRGGEKSFSSVRIIGAPILFMFYLLDPYYVNRSPRVNLPQGHEVAGENSLPVFIVSLPPDGPIGDNAWVNSRQRNNPDITYSGETGVVDKNPMM